MRVCEREREKRETQGEGEKERGELPDFAFQIIVASFVLLAIDV